MYALGQTIVREMPDLLEFKFRELLLAYTIMDGFTIAIIIGVLLTLGHGDRSGKAKEVDIIGDGKQALPPTGQAFPRTPEELYQYALQVDGITQQQKYGQGPLPSA